MSAASNRGISCSRITPPPVTALIAALQVLAELVAAASPRSELLHLFDPLPQLLKNVRFAGGQPLDDETVKAVIAEAEQELNGTRPPGDPQIGDRAADPRDGRRRR
jgi:hypothetical protein